MTEKFDLVDLFKQMDERRASDLHLQVGSHPAFRIKGEIVRSSEFQILDEKQLETLIYAILSEREIALYKEKGTVDTAIGFPEIGRFRLSVFRQRGSIALVARRLSLVIPDFNSLNLPDSISTIAEFPIGLVLVTGPTGSGKSSTLAALINSINHKRRCHILCIEDPIEYLYKNAEAIITQREIGIDVPSFSEALKYAVRQDPDVILVGEIRDRDTMEFAIRAAETGHLVFGTLHSSNATQTIGRILNFFPPVEHSGIRKAVSMHLKAVVSQLLLPSLREDVPVVPAIEIMFVNPIIARLISEGQDEKIMKGIRAGRNEGMQDFEQALLDLVNRGWISQDVALGYAENPHSLEMKLRGISLSEETGIIS